MKSSKKNVWNTRKYVNQINQIKETYQDIINGRKEMNESNLMNVLK